MLTNTITTLQVLSLTFLLFALISCISLFCNVQEVYLIRYLLGKGILFLSGSVVICFMFMQVERKENVETDNIAKVSEEGSVYSS